MFDLDLRRGVVYVKPYRHEFRIDEKGYIMLLKEEARDLSGALRMITEWPPPADEPEDA